MMPSTITLGKEKISRLLLMLMILVLFVSGCQSQSTEGQSSAPVYPGNPASMLTLAFSTYIGGSAYDNIRDVATDSQGNIYMTGGTNSDNFPTTLGAYKRTHDRSGTQTGSAGYMDAFVTKLSPDGQIVWSTLVGGPNYDRAYGVKVDSQGYVYIAGRAGPGLPTTPEVFQPSFNGYNAGGSSIYGYQNGFIAKLLPDGSGLVWMSYFGVGTLIRELDIDEVGDIYVASGYNPSGSPTTPPSGWFKNAYLKTPIGGMDGYVAKVKSNGTQVYWATYVGGSLDEAEEQSVRVNRTDHSVYVQQVTLSTNAPCSPGCYRNYNAGGRDYYITKLSSDGSTLVFGTYIGGTGDDWNNTHNLALDNQGNVYVSAAATSGWPTTPGAFQKNYGGGTNDVGISKISSDGTQLLASTFIAGNAGDNPDGIWVDSGGKVYVTGNTSSTNFPVTSDAFQSFNKGGQDGFLTVLSSDFSKLLYSTYIGGNGDDSCRSGAIDSNLNFIGACVTVSDNWPILNAFQTFRRGDYDGALAKFIPSK